MDILFLLIPLSAVLVLLILAVFGWAVFRGQFDDIEGEGQRILDNDRVTVDDDQSSPPRAPEQSGQSVSRT